MFGMISGMFRSKSTTPNPATTPMTPIMVSDYIETASITPDLRGINKKIITNDLLNIFNNNVMSKHLLYLDGVIGKNDGTFPVTNPTKNNVYFYAVERKYYKCNKSVSGVVNAPDTNFSEFSLFNFKGGVSGITITGAATGSGQLDEATGMMTVNTSVEYSKITGTPSSLPNPNSLTIKLNGNSGTAYSGSSAVELNITAESIGAQKAGNYASADHNHDSVYAPIKHSHSDYALTSHTHTANQIGAMTGYVKASEGGAISVTDTLLAAIGKLEKGLDGKQAAGNYSVVGHNHNDLYNTKEEVTNLLAGKLGKSENAVSATKLATARTIAISGAVSGSKEFDGSGNIIISTTLNGLDASKIVSGTISVDRLPKTALSEFVAVKDKTARLALTKEEVQNGDTVKETDSKRMYLVIDDTKLNTEEGYQEYTTIVDWSTITGKPSEFTPISHVHTWAQISDRPSTMASPHALTISLNGKAQTAYSGASAVSFNITPDSIGAQVAGDYAEATHNHDGVYAKVTHSHAISEIGALAGYAKAGSVSAITTSDTILSAIGKLEKALDGKQASGSYALSNHNHDGVYQPKGSYASATHTHSASDISTLTGYKKAESVSAISVTDTLLVALGKLERALDSKQATGNYSVVGHTHTEYQPKGDYAAASHNHDTAYAAKSHGHAWGEITGKPGSFTPSAHNQASNTITAMTGYTKASAVAAIAATDSLNVAIGKLEKALDGKQASGSYASSSHNHDGVYQPKGSYALSTHNHNGVYAPASHSHSYLPLSGGTLTGSLTMADSKTIVCSYNYGIQHKKSDGTAVYSLLITSDNRLHVGYNNTIPITLDSSDVKVQGNSVWHAGNLNPNNYQPKGSYASSSHNHSGVYAPVSHGNHVPATQTANNKIFLRCDNTWHTITPAEIGAQPAGSYATANHTHTGYAASNHTHTGYLSTSGGTVSGALTVTGQILSNADVVAYSDARMKTNVVKIDSALDKVSSINGYTYDMQGVEFGGQRQAGVLAQELKEVLPEAVVTDDNGYYAVRYTNIIPLLIEALKEEKSKRESLEERLAKIERMLDIK